VAREVSRKSQVVKRKVASQRKERKGQRDVVETVVVGWRHMEKKRGCVTVAPKAANRRKALAPERFKNPFRRDATDRGLPSVPTVAGVRRDTGAGVGGFALGFVVDERSARDSRRARGRRAVAPRTVLEHLQQREGRDLDVLRGVHLRGIPRGRLGSAPHHTPATHHPGDVHRARFTCAWPVRVRREVDARAKPDLMSFARSKGTRQESSRFRPFAWSEKSAVARDRKVNSRAAPRHVCPSAAGPVRALRRERVWHRSRCHDAPASARSSRTWAPPRVRCGRNALVPAPRPRCCVPGFAKR